MKRMAGVRDFRELAAWQRADELRDLCLALLKRPDVIRNTKYAEQLSDACGSAPRNIAEGFSRYRHREFAQFVRIAKGSAGEILDLFIEGKKRGYIAAEDFPKHETAARRALATAARLIKYLENSEEP